MDTAKHRHPTTAAADTTLCWPRTPFRSRARVDTAAPTSSEVPKKPSPTNVGVATIGAYMWRARRAAHLCRLEVVDVRPPPDLDDHRVDGGNVRFPAFGDSAAGSVCAAFGDTC